VVGSQHGGVGFVMFDDGIEEIGVMFKKRHSHATFVELRLF
jgi:hypothetical protein